MQGDRIMETKVSSVLKHKGHDVVTVAPQQTVGWVVKVLAENRIGAVPVINDEGQLIGIISERDIIRGMSEHADAVLTLAADRLMTRDVKTCSSEDQLVDLMEVMTLQRITSMRSTRSEEHTSELQSHLNLVCRLLLEKKKTNSPDPH